MNVNNFKEEFSQLLLKYISHTSNLTPETRAFLTNKEILDAIQETLHRTLNTNFRDVNSEDLKTPTNEIVITTPNAPDIAKVKYDGKDGGLLIRDQSLQPNMSLCIDTADMDTSEIDTTPTVDVNQNTVSDKTGQQDGSSLITVEPIVIEELQDFRKALQSELSKLADSQRNAMYKTIEDARRDALSVLDKIEDIRDLLTPQLKPNRRLSSLLELPQPMSQSRQTTNGPSSNLRVSQRRSIQATRRSLSSQQKRSDTSVTPTSRLSLIRAPPTSPSGNERSSVASKIKTSDKLDAQSHSISISSLPASLKSPCKKNPKYAHVQSTIPKPMPTLKRKAT